MNNRVGDILAEKLVSVNLNDSVQATLEEAKNIRVEKIMVHDETGNFWVVSSWKLRLLDPNITLKQAYDEKKEIFEKVKTVSIDEEISKIISDLYELPGLIVIEEGKIKGFVSLADYLAEFEQKPLDIIKEKAKIKEGLVGIDLHESYLVGIDLPDANMRGADLSKADLSKANLRNANLTSANLSNGNLTDAKLVRAKLREANLKDAILINADLRNAELWYANLQDAQLQGAILRDAVLFRANLKSAKLENADLYNAGLMSANLEGADLSNADIRNANLKYATFDEKTKLSGIKINSITIDNLTESALKAEWDPEIKQYLKKKYG